MLPNHVRPKVGQLTLHLFDRPLHPELFEVLAERTAQYGEFRLRIRITPTGHVISWENGSAHLTEVATTADAPLPNLGHRINHRIRGEQCDSWSWAPGFSYQTSFQVEAMTDEVFVHFHEELQRDGLRRGLLHNFQPHHRLSLSPLGFVVSESCARNLILSTFHTFPDERTVVKTQSLIERRAEKP